MIIVGVYSEIGGGKTFVSGMFEELGAKIINADNEIAKLLENDIMKSDIESKFPESITDNIINRKKLAELAFSNENKLRVLESILHPPVFEIIRNKIDSERVNGTGILILDVPLLYGSKLEDSCEVKIFIETPEKIRLERLKKFRKINEEEVKKRAKFQPSIKSKKQKANFIINNSGNRSETFQEVSKVYQELVKMVNDNPKERC